MELRKLYEEEKKSFEGMHETLKGKIDGEIDMDMHGNFTFRPSEDKKDE